MLEVMGVVMQRVLNDVVSGTVRCYGDEPGPDGALPVRVGWPSQIDFQSYLREYWLCMLMADFAAWCRTLQPEQESVLKPTADEVHVFGGT